VVYYSKNAYFCNGACQMLKNKDLFGYAARRAAVILKKALAERH
jgi:hypothetical protein